VIDFMLKKIRIKLVLAHIDRVLEVLGGVIMVLTFTSVLSVSHAGKADVRAMLIGSLGCNLAWGIIDAIMYLLNSLAERSRELDALRAVRAAKDPEEAQRMLAAELPEQFAAVLSPGELEPVLRRLRALPAPSARPRLTGDDWLGAFGIFGLVFFATLPIVLPFLLVSRPALALRVSNLVAIGLLFLTGYIFGRNTGHNPWRLGIAMVLIGCLLAGVAISLGG
jgi:VIT1/CCC1 family predicted Fe2+/Mn2+ transporter